MLFIDLNATNNKRKDQESSASDQEEKKEEKKKQYSGMFKYELSIKQGRPTALLLQMWKVISSLINPLYIAFHHTRSQFCVKNILP